MKIPAVYANLSVPRRAHEAIEAGAEGVGLLRAEFLVYRAGRHPALLLTDSPPNDLKTIVADAMRTVARAMHPNPVFYRTLDLRSNEVRKLLGGGELEDTEENPALGCRGMARARRDSEAFDIEVGAARQVRDEGFDNLNLLLPFVRWPEEVSWARERLERQGLGPESGVKLFMMVETPSTVLRAAEYAPLVDGISVGSNDLTQLVLGIDRDNVAFARQDWDDDPAVLSCLRWAIEAYKAEGVPVGICGDAPSRSEVILKSLLEWGLDSISVSLSQVALLKEMIAQSVTAPERSRG